MRFLSSALACVPLLLAACNAPRTSASTASASSPAPPGAQGAAPAKERTGVIVPVDGTAISLWPDAYTGELLVLEVIPHGSDLVPGTVIAKLSTRAIDEQLRNAELELRSAEIRHQGQIGRNAIDDAAAQSALAQARAALDRARRALDGWREQELAFSERADEVQRRYESANVDDQTDELDQLEKMYKEDELTDATEEIVLKRSRRGLENTRVLHALHRDRRKYQVAIGEKLEIEQREEAVRIQQEALERTQRAQAIETRAREDAAARSAAALDEHREKLARLKRDRELFEVRAPRAGVLLHGSAKSLRAGGAPVRHERGSVLAPRTEAFVVADPARIAVALDVPESSLTRLRPGGRVTVRPVARPNEKLTGTIALEPWPGARPAGEENGYEGTIALDSDARGLLFGAKVKVEFDEVARSEP